MLLKTDWDDVVSINHGIPIKSAKKGINNWNLVVNSWSVSSGYLFEFSNYFLKGDCEMSMKKMRFSTLSNISIRSFCNPADQWSVKYLSTKCGIFLFFRSTDSRQQEWEGGVNLGQSDRQARASHLASRRTWPPVCRTKHPLPGSP